MIVNAPKTKLLFFDLETVGIEPDFKTLKKNKPELAKMFEKYQSWIVKRYPEEEGKSIDEMFYNKAALIPEFAKIIVASFSFIAPNGETHKQTFSSDNEVEVLNNVKDLLTKVGKMDFWLCGHNIKNFDIPMIGKRMMIHGIQPPSIIPTYDTKPWEVKAVDTMDIWKFGNNFSMASLELMCVTMGISSPKEGEVTGNIVHQTYWETGALDPIATYCEEDVDVLRQLMDKIYSLV
jgi:DNA polymerase elongation subunit (family B)